MAGEGSQMCISGDWDRFSFKRIESSDLPSVLANLRNNFYIDEPLNKLLGYSEERFQDVDNGVTNTVQGGLCFFAVEKEANKIAGVQILSRKTGKVTSNVQLKSPISHALWEILGQSIYSNLDICEQFQVNTYVHLVFMSVSKDFRGLGLSHELMKRTIALCKSENVPLIESIFSNPLSRQSALKCGFQEIRRVYYEDMKKNHPTIKFATEPVSGEFAAVMILKL